MDVLSKQATSVPAKDPDLPETVTSGVGHHVKKDAFVVAWPKSEPDQIPGTPNSPFGERQVHSCPPTSLLDHATPQQEDARKLGIGATVLAAVPSSPGLRYFLIPNHWFFGDPLDAWELQGLQTPK
eukprot:s1940_g1.t1